jgi:Pre-mRNA 3''-end processing (cleavage and polyadenylation) factor
MCPKDKIFRGYIDMEHRMYEFGRCRTLFQKQIEWNPSNTQSWLEFADLERNLDDAERTRAIYELAIEQSTLDMPELVWKAYIDFEEEENEYERVRQLYERLLQKTDHVKVWLNYARFESSVLGEEGEEEEEEEEEKPLGEDAIIRSRAVFSRAEKALKDKGLTNDVSCYSHNPHTIRSILTCVQRVAILDAWQAFEHESGSPEDIEKVDKQMPRRVKKRRKLGDDKYEEYLDYVFPADDQSAANLSRLLQKAHQWKQQNQS